MKIQNYKEFINEAKVNEDMDEKQLLKQLRRQC